MTRKLTLALLAIAGAAVVSVASAAPFPGRDVLKDAIVRQIEPDGFRAVNEYWFSNSNGAQSLGGNLAVASTYSLTTGHVPACTSNTAGRWSWVYSEMSMWSMVRKKGKIVYLQCSVGYIAPNVFWGAVGLPSPAVLRGGYFDTWVYVPIGNALLDWTFVTY